MKDQLSAIFRSYINGQIEQMHEQIKEYKNMYDFFEHLKEFLVEMHYDNEDAFIHFADIVIKYHRIEYR